MTSSRTDDSGDGTPVVIVVDGELDASDAGWTADLDRAVLDGHRHIVVDMLGVSFVDSSVVRALVSAYRASVAAGGWLRVVYTHHLIRRVIVICGLADALPQYTSLDAALRGSPSALRPDDDSSYGELREGAAARRGSAHARPGGPNRQGSTPS